MATATVVWGGKKVLTTANGIPQGGTISSLAFGCVLKLAFRGRRLAAHGLHMGERAIADVVLAMDSEVVHLVWDEWQGALHHLQIKEEKTVIYSPSQVGNQERALAEIWATLAIPRRIGAVVVSRFGTHKLGWEMLRCHVQPMLRCIF
eukprot:2013001-Amphidinium_carterae.1